MSVEVAPVELVDTSGLLPGFTWGVATSAYQVEGLGKPPRGRSIWDSFAEQAGAIVDGSTAEVAANQFARVDDDAALLQQLGVDAYRMSVSWSRLQPDGFGQLSSSGLAWYDRVVDQLLSVGIKPWVTLYHWDLPQMLADRGGWTVRDSMEWFTEYAVAVHAALGDRVRTWMTLNEPWCSAWLGYGVGAHAPGVADVGSAAKAAHHLLLAHGSALAHLRSQAPADHNFGVVLNPGSYRLADGVGQQLAEPQASVVAEAVQLLDGIRTRWWLDALLLGRYPQDVLMALQPHLDGVVVDNDLEIIAQPLDFLGVNYYSDQILEPLPAEMVSDPIAAGDIPVEWSHDLPGLAGVRLADPGAAGTTMGWPVTPEGLPALLRRISEIYPSVPMVITENGAAFARPSAATEETDPSDGGSAEHADRRQVQYLHDHIAALMSAVADGSDIRGYFAWTLMDNFEWNQGYTQHFGLASVAHDGSRNPRDSFSWYQQQIAAARLVHRLGGGA